MYYTVLGELSIEKKMRRTEDVYNIIKAGLANSKILARYSLKKQWSRMSKAERWEAGRALAFMDRLSRYPEIYFSRKDTQDAWVKRATKLAYERNISLNDAFYIAKDPVTIVYKSAGPAVWSDEKSLFYQFCCEIRDWEYARTRKDYVGAIQERKSLTNLVKTAEKIQNRVDIINTNIIFRPFKSFLYQFQR